MPLLLKNYKNTTKVFAPFYFFQGGYTFVLDRFYTKFPYYYAYKGTLNTKQISERLLRCAKGKFGKDELFMLAGTLRNMRPFTIHRSDPLEIFCSGTGSFNLGDYNRWELLSKLKRFSAEDRIKRSKGKTTVRYYPKDFW